MFEEIITPNRIGTYYATENAKLPGIECPRCESVNPLGKLVADKKCENCGLNISLRMKVEDKPELSKGAKIVLRFIEEEEPVTREKLEKEMQEKLVANDEIEDVLEVLEEEDFIAVEGGVLKAENRGFKNEQ